MHKTNGFTRKRFIMTRSALTCVSRVKPIVLRVKPFVIKVSPCVWRRNINIIQYTGYSLRVMRDWLITARKLITQKSPNTKLYRKTILYICTYIDQYITVNFTLVIIIFFCNFSNYL